MILYDLNIIIIKDLKHSCFCTQTAVFLHSHYKQNMCFFEGISRPPSCSLSIFHKLHSSPCCSSNISNLSPSTVSFPHFRSTLSLNTLAAFSRLCCISVSLDFSPSTNCRPGREKDCWRRRAMPEVTSCSTAGPLFSLGAGNSAIISHESFHMGKEAVVSHHCFSCLPTKKKR